MSLRMHAGGFTAEVPPPPPGTLYGPTLGAQAVRDGTIPHAVGDPGGSRTLVNPGDSISGKITTAGTNGTLWFTKGTYNLTTTLTPLAGQTWVLESAAGYTRTAADSAVLSGAAALMNTALVRGQTALTIRGGVFTGINITAADFVGALQNTAGAARPQAGWTIEDAIVTGNATCIGIHADGDNTIIRRCYVHTNGNYGVSGTNAVSGSFQNDLLVENSRIANNNTQHRDPAWDSGATKWTGSRNAIIRSNWFHDNYGSAVWFDGSNVNCIIEENVCEDNRAWGTFWEISSGGTYIRHNLYARNGEGNGGNNAYNDSQILVSTSDATSTVYGTAPTFPSIEIQNNTLTGYSVQMYVVDTAGHITGYPSTRSVHYHDNDVTITAAIANRIGGTTNTNVNDIFTRDNTWENNHYHTTNTGTAYFNWSGGSPGVGSTKTWAQWQAFGQDVTGGSID